MTTKKIAATAACIALVLIVAASLFPEYVASALILMPGVLPFLFTKGVHGSWGTYSRLIIGAISWVFWFYALTCTIALGSFMRRKLEGRSHKKEGPA